MSLLVDPHSAMFSADVGQSSLSHDRQAWPNYLQLATSEMWCWSGGRGILIKLSLCYSIVYYYNGARRYEQFLQVGRLYWTLILLGLALCLPIFQEPLCLRSSWCYVDIKNFCLHPSLYFLVSWAWWDWPLTWLTNRCPSVLWHCWLGHLTRKSVLEMTCSVSSGTLNPTIPYTWCNCSIGGQNPPHTKPL